MEPGDRNPGIQQWRESCERYRARCGTSESLLIKGSVNLAEALCSHELSLVLPWGYRLGLNCIISINRGKQEKEIGASRDRYKQVNYCRYV
jgi:hypothetical protein